MSYFYLVVGGFSISVHHGYMYWYCTCKTDPLRRLHVVYPSRRNVGNRHFLAALFIFPSIHFALAPKSIAFLASEQPCFAQPSSNRINDMAWAVEAVPEGEVLESGWEELGMDDQWAARVATEMADDDNPALPVDFYKVI